MAWKFRGFLHRENITQFLDRTVNNHSPVGNCIQLRGTHQSQLEFQMENFLLCTWHRLFSYVRNATLHIAKIYSYEGPWLKVLIKGSWATKSQQGAFKIYAHGILDVSFLLTEPYATSIFMGNFGANSQWRILNSDLTMNRCSTSLIIGILDVGGGASLVLTINRMFHTSNWSSHLFEFHQGKKEVPTATTVA